MKMGSIFVGTNSKTLHNKNETKMKNSFIPITLLYYIIKWENKFLQHWPSLVLWFGEQ